MLKQFLSNLMNKNEHTISNRYIADMISNDMKSINRDLYDIRKSLSELTDIDYAGDIADNISTYEIARHLGDSIDIDATDIEIDYRDLGSRIANEIYSNDRIDTIERKMDLILKHLGITPENV